METFGSFLDEEWESLSKMFSSEDSDLLLHFDGGNLFQNQGEISSTSFSNNVHDLSSFCPSDAFDETNFYSVSQESSNSSDIESALFTNSIHEIGLSFLHNVMTNAFEPTSFCTTNDGLMVPVLPHDHVMEENVGIHSAETGYSYKEIELKRKSEIQALEDQSPKKKPRVSKDNGPKNKSNTQSKKSKKAIIQNEEQENNGCSSEEDDSNASNGKKRASRGSATDPQSLYARRRRERINERLRILQNLVPNGKKVDISTMLEEAVHYVKFLQLQIKLLSSDELWMYAPIAYNGMDMGLYQKIIPNLLCGI